MRVQGLQAAMLHDGQQHQRPHALRLQARGPGGDAGIIAHIADRQQLARARLRRAQEVMVQGQQSVHRRHAGCRPDRVTAPQPGLRVDPPITAALGLQRFAHDARGDRAGRLGLLHGPQRIGQPHQGVGPARGERAGGDIDALQKDAGHDAIGRPHRLQHQIDVAVLRRPILRHPDRIVQRLGMVGPTTAHHLVQQRQLALRDRIGQRLRKGAPQQRTVAHQAQVARIGHREDVAGALQHRHETGRVIEQTLQVGTLVAHRALGLHAARGLHHHGHRADRAPLGIQQRRVIQIDPDRPGLPVRVAAQHQLVVFVAEAATGQADLQHMRRERRHLIPALVHR
jgi:hypothetical protein